MDLATTETKEYGDQLAVTADQAERLAKSAAAGITIPVFTPAVIPSFGGGGVSDAARAAEQAAAQAAAEAERRAEEARRREKERLEKRRADYQSFADSVKSIFGQIRESILSSFNLPKLGSSVNAITRNIAKLLERTKGFAKSITQLSGLGLNSALLQQVIQAGPMAGSQLASAIVGGGSAFVSQLNAAYGEFGNLASGIANVGTTSAFSTQQTVNNYNIAVNGGLATGAVIGRAVVNAIKNYESQSGAAWRA
jgi:hypothetical protein